MLRKPRDGLCRLTLDTDPHPPGNVGPELCCKSSTHMHIHMCTHAHTSTRPHIHMHTHTPAHTHTHKHLHTHTPFTSLSCRLFP